MCMVVQESANRLGVESYLKSCNVCVLLFQGEGEENVLFSSLPLAFSGV